MTRETPEKTAVASTDTTRRSVLGLVAGVAAFGGATVARAADGVDHSQMDHGNMDHGQMDHSKMDHATWGKNGPGHSMEPKNAKLVDAAFDCQKAGQACIEHCIDLMASGDASLKDCMRSVEVMLPTIAALAKHAAFDSKRLKAVATLCRDICQDCEGECKKHEEKHALCKACRESCTACIKECNAVIGG
ncbi:MAG: four-helix bundle copper-binding protein [Hyphomicrobium sp.]|nr:four-helix bundle copper-binding protein [Hyphomicrobium sp.]